MNSTFSYFDESSGGDFHQLNISGSQASDLISKLERFVDSPVPESYRNWLRHYEYFQNQNVCVFGLVGDGSLFEQQENWSDCRLLNIANDGCGNYFALDYREETPSKHCVLFIDSYGEPDEARLVASDFEKFFKGVQTLTETGPQWPYNQSLIQQIDPDVFQIQGIRFVWED